jgi:RsiW-degrading membrane proteinase PrsW (M82 family)
VSLTLEKETKFLTLNICLQGLDLGLTWLFVWKLGIASEYNPLMHTLPLLLIVKASMIGLLVFYYFKDRKHCLAVFRLIATIYCIALTCALCAVFSS